MKRRSEGTWRGRRQKTAQDRLPVAGRPRVAEARARAARMKRGGA